MHWQDEITKWIRWLAAGGARPETRRLRRYQMQRVGRALGGQPFSVAPDRLESWLSQQVWKPETRRSYLGAIRSFYRWAIDHELTSVDPTVRLPRLHPQSGEPRPASEQAIDRALALADDRQRLMIELAARHGLRRGEIARIHATDVVESAGGWSLVVDGKGGKERVVPLMPNAARVMLDRAAGGWLFANGLGSHLTPGHVGVLITRALPSGVTPHMLRHRFATVVYRKTLDIRNLQKLLGHANVSTTQRYAAPDPDVLRSMMAAAA